MAVTLPAMDEGTSIVALSVSSSSTAWSLASGVADLHEHVQHVAGRDVFAQLGQREISHYDTAGSSLFESMPSVLIAFWTTDTSSSPARTSAPSVATTT